MTGVNNSRIAGLDGLRALAALAVFAVHFQQESGFAVADIGDFSLTRLLINGNTGVALFFALSGYLLSIPFWQEKLGGAQWPSASHYWLRRLARIAPAYYVCLLALVVENGYWKEADKFNDVLLHFLFLFNYSNDYFYSINPPFWTIGIEMQFYVLLPLVFLLLRPLGSRATGLVLAALIAGCYLAHAALMNSGLVGGTAATHSVLAHLPHFLIGVLFGQLNCRPEGAPAVSNSVGWGIAFWGGGLVVLLVLATPLAERLSLPYGRYNFPLIPLLLALIVVAATRSRSARAVLETRVLAWVGSISYGIYLFHLPLQKLTAKLMKAAGMAPGESWLLFGVFSLIATLVLASLSYVFFERPVMAFVKSRNRG